MGISFSALLRAHTTQNMKNNMITIEQIKELLEKATPGEYDYDIETTSCGKPCTVEGCLDDHPTGRMILLLPNSECGFGSLFLTNKYDAKLISKIGEIAQLCLDQAAEIAELKLTLRGKTFTE